MVTFDQRWQDPFLELQDEGSYLVKVLEKALDLEIFLAQF